MSVMNELICKRSIECKIRHWREKLSQDYGENDEYVRCLDSVLDVYISAAPTVDAQPVVHGRWIESVIERTMGALNGYKCSICGHEKIGRTCLYNYCPECGAKMDEKVNE